MYIYTNYFFHTGGASTIAVAKIILQTHITHLNIKSFASTANNRGQAEARFNY